MGEVYLGEDARLGRRVAIKVLPPHFTGDAERIRRFAVEARAASSLNHPHIITIFDIGEDEGRHFIASEFVEGSTLRQLLSAGRLKVSDALDIGIQAASAISAAHEAGIVHRDIKPENIIRRPDGYIKVLDFGLAKLTEAPLMDSASGSTQSLLETEPGRVLGTIAYMSPEQARGLRLDGRSDIFSLGVVLYELLSGARPFDGVTPTDVLVALIERQPERLSSRVDDIPPEVEEIVFKALEKDSGARYQTASAMLQDLRRAKARIDSAETEAITETRPLDSTDSIENVATMPMSGLIGNVSSPVGTDPYATSVASSARIAASNAHRSGRRSRKWQLAGAVALIGVLTAVAVSFFNRSSARIDSLAVMPFSDQQPGYEYLSDGITESLISQLSQLPDLSVISRNSVFAFKGKQVDVRELAQSLGVNAVLFGVVRREGTDVIISTELVDSKTRRQIWGEQFRKNATDLIALQEQVVGAIASRLRARLSATDRASALSMPTAKNDAYDLYLRARYFWNEGTPTSLKEADELFERAASIDPQFALAQAGCAATHAFGGDYDKPPDECMPKAKSAALSVLKRNGRIPDAHLTLARVSWSYDRDFDTAERVFRRAIELEPRNALSHIQYAEMLAVLGRKDDAQNEVDLAIKAAPASAPVARTAALVKYYDRRYDEAIELLTRAISLDAKYYPAHELLARVYEVKGLKLEAIEKYLAARFLVEGGSSHVGSIKDAYGQGGWTGFWRRELEHLNGNARTSYVPPSTIAEAYLRLDDSSKALQQLNRAIDIRDGSVLAIKVDPLYNNLRSVSGFDALSKRIELKPSPR